MPVRAYSFKVSGFEERGQVKIKQSSETCDSGANNGYTNYSLRLLVLIIFTPNNRFSCFS
jgi:hypothetical protein